MSKEASVKSPSSTLDRANRAHIAKLFLVCDQKDTAPTWGDFLRQQRLSLFIESSIEKVIGRWSTTLPNNVRICYL